MVKRRSNEPLQNCSLEPPSVKLHGSWLVSEPVKVTTDLPLLAVVVFSCGLAVDCWLGRMIGPFCWGRVALLPSMPCNACAPSASCSYRSLL